jgi:hypothetical protein
MEEVMGGEEGGYQPNTDIYAVPVTMTVGGELDDLENFIDDIIHSDKRILFVGYSWGQFRDVIRRDSEGNVIEESSSVSTDAGVTSEELEDETVEVVTKRSLTIHLEIYMCDTSAVATDTDATEE